MYVCVYIHTYCICISRLILRVDETPFMRVWVFRTYFITGQPMRSRERELPHDRTAPDYSDSTT